jgi:hypothetical protein
MKIGFDLDGTLDRPVLRDLCVALLQAGHEIHIISGVFPDATGWQDGPAKHEKLARLGIPVREWGRSTAQEMAQKGPYAYLHVLNALPSTFDRNYRLIDLGLRKGEICERLGITLFVEDSALYAEMLPKMSGGTLVLLIPTYAAK